MSRRKAAPKRKILPDPKFGNLKVAKFMNQIMTDGKSLLLKKSSMEPLMRYQRNQIKNQ